MSTKPHSLIDSKSVTELPPDEVSKPMLDKSVTFGEKPQKPQKPARDPMDYIDNPGPAELPDEFRHEGFHPRFVVDTPAKINKARRRGYEIAHNDRNEVWRIGTTQTLILMERPLEEHLIAEKLKNDRRIELTEYNKHSQPSQEGIERREDLSRVESQYGDGRR